MKAIKKVGYESEEINKESKGFLKSCLNRDWYNEKNYFNYKWNALCQLCS
jgi:hypothetical protein